MKNLTIKQKKFLLIFLTLFIVTSSAALIPTDYYFMSPGPPYQWEIEYGDIDNYLFEGNLFLPKTDPLDLDYDAPNQEDAANHINNVLSDLIISLTTIEVNG